MELHVRVLHQERPQDLGLIRGRIVGDDMNLTTSRLAGDDGTEEFDKRRDGVPRHGLTEHLARLGVECRQQRERPVSVIFKAVPLGPTWRQWQHRMQAVECLNRGFLIDREDRGVVRRIDVQADDVGRFLFEVGIVRRPVALEPMRLQPRALPRFADEIVVNLQDPSQLARTPMREPAPRRCARCSGLCPRNSSPV